MSPQKPSAQPTTRSITSYVRKNAPKVREAQHHHPEVSETIREATYKGHHIVIRTTYTIQVDGVPVTGHLGVADDGQVHYHPIPNASFASAIDLVKQLIDIFPEDFAGGGHSADPAGGHMHRAVSHPPSASPGRRPRKAK